MFQKRVEKGRGEEGREGVTGPDLVSAPCSINLNSEKGEKRRRQGKQRGQKGNKGT